MKLSFRLLTVLAASILLNGCYFKTFHKHPPTLLQHRKQIAQNIIDSGVQVIQLGDTVRLVIPADNFFIGNSPRLSKKGRGKLNLIASYLYMTPTTAVKVTGYTDNSGNLHRDLALSKARAEETVNQLWSRGIDVRVMSAEGMGVAYPVANNDTDKGRAANRRVEITLRKYAV